MRAIVLFAFALSGAAALIYEVAWTRELSLVLGSTTYALSTMLATFMAGLAIGSFVGGRLADRVRNLLLLLGAIEFLIGVFGLVTLPLISVMPKLYLAVYQQFHPDPALYFIFQFFLCALVMLVPTTLMGATFPVVSRLLTPRLEELGKWVGNAYSCNTFGAILGSLAAGFLLIPLVGVRVAALTAASLNLMVAVAMIILSGFIARKALVAMLVVVFAGTAVLAWSVERRESWFINFYSAFKLSANPIPVSYDETHRLLYDKDFPQGRVKLWRADPGYITIQAGGKQEGGSPAAFPTSVLLSYLPIAAHSDPDSLLNIGLGVGISLTAAKDRVEDVVLVEINPGVVEAIGRYGPPGIFEGVDVNVNDARNYLFLTDRKFDIIASTPSYPSEAGSANLFTVEFYRLASSRLNPGGVFSQWIPRYLLSESDVVMLLKTFRAGFRYVYMTSVGDAADLILLGSSVPFQYSSGQIMRNLQDLNPEGYDLPVHITMTPSAVDEMTSGLKDVPLNTDDRPILEFHVARNLITGLR